MFYCLHLSPSSNQSNPTSFVRSTITSACHPTVITMVEKGTRFNHHELGHHKNLGWQSYRKTQCWPVIIGRAHAMYIDSEEQGWQNGVGKTIIGSGVEKKAVSMRSWTNNDFDVWIGWYRAE